MSRIPSNKPWDIKNRAGNIYDPVMSNDPKKIEASIKCLEAEGFKNARSEIMAYREQYWDVKHPLHKATVDLMAEMLKARGDWL